MKRAKFSHATSIWKMSKETAQMDLNQSAPSLLRRRGLIGALASLAILVLGSFAALPASAAPEDFAFETVGASLSTGQAGAHADFTTEFTFNGGNPDFFGQPLPWGAVKELSVELPRGMAGNPQAFPTCDTAVFIGASPQTTQADPTTPQCPTDSQLGLVSPGLFNSSPPGVFEFPLYNLESPGGDVVARLGFWALFFPAFVDIRVDPERDNALIGTVSSTPNIDTTPLTAAITTVWGVPTDPSHDIDRITPFEAALCEGLCPPDKGGPPAPRTSGLGERAFLANPTSCGPKEVNFAANVYALPARFASATAPLPEDISGCEEVPFKPTLSLQPTTRSAGSPSGVHFELHVPQDGLLNPDGLASAHLKKAVVTLPEGVGINAGSADGLGSCSEAEVGLISESPVRFNGREPGCPESSKIGTGEILTPVLDEPLEGSLYVARQDDNPFDSLLAGYLVAKGRGVMVKQAGKFDLSPSGRVTAVFDNNPQLPFSDLELHFKGGERGVLTTPSQCDVYQTEYELTPWSGNPPTVGTSSFTIDQNCDLGGFAPGFDAGTTSPVAGTYSPFVLRLTRSSGSPQLTGLSVSPPSGLLGKLAGIPYCEDAALAAISPLPGSGVAELAASHCPAASQIGSVTAGAGSGSPFYVTTGRVYLAGPYRGAPLSLVVVTPAVAGPFDLGNVVVRTALYLDPETAQLRAVSDPLPTILQGIPLNLRDLRVMLDRSEFTLNPTNCEERSVNGTVSGTGGVTAAVSDRFQVSGCGDLGFRPRLNMRLLGGTQRGDHPRLRAIVRPRSGDANIGRAVVSLPRSEFLDQGHIRTVCTRVQFAADSCPSASIYGHATATTPLLDGPLSGPVYLRSSDNELPDLVADLRGQVRIALVGRIDSPAGRGIRTTFAAPPDAPVSKFVLRMRGGERGLLVNSRNLCAQPARATARLVGQNGRALTLRPKMRTSCSQGTQGKPPR
jgi:hypothetical protein